MKFIKIGTTLVNVDHIVSIQIDYDYDSEYSNYIEFCSTHGTFKSNYKQINTLSDDSYLISKFLDSDKTKILRLKEKNN